MGSGVSELHDLAAGLEDDEWLELAGTDAAKVPDGCLLDELGMVLTDVGRGRARGRMEVTRRHLNQRGIVQAGAIVAFADAMAGWATYTSVPGRFATVNLTTNLLRAAAEGDVLVAEARVVHPGRTTHVLDVVVSKRVAGHEDTPIARFTCTQLILGEGPAR